MAMRSLKESECAEYAMHQLLACNRLKRIRDFPAWLRIRKKMNLSVYYEPPPSEKTIRALWRKFGFGSGFTCDNPFHRANRFLLCSEEEAEIAQARCLSQWIKVLYGIEDDVLVRLELRISHIKKSQNAIRTRAEEAEAKGENYISPRPNFGWPLDWVLGEINVQYGPYSIPEIDKNSTESPNDE